MKDATPIEHYFHDDKALFLIPLYQRKYSWQKKHCQRLYTDLLKIHRGNLYSHFFGSIVSIKASETDNDLLIIDGQQRLTTISLLILAAINAVKNGGMICENEEFLKDTRDKFLFSKYKKHVDRKIKLCPIEEDRVAYDSLFSNEEENFIPAEKSGITSNYQFLYNLIVSADKDFTFENLIEAIEKLIIIDICLDSKDNPQLIFESLNSCGKDLEEADKVRNYLLMSESKNAQELYYHNYWHKIEENTNGEPTMFIRDYLTIKNKVISSIDNLYFDFKQYHEEKNISREELLQDMLKFSKYYKEVDKACTGIERIDKKLRQLASIGSNVGMSFYMNFFDYAKENNLSENLQYEVLDIIENYWARRIICALPANVLAKTFALLHSDVMRVYKLHEKKGKDVTVSYAEILKYILLKKQGTGSFPNDNNVKEMFPQRQIYKIPASYRIFLFERLENLNSKEYKETIVKNMNNGNYTIEHIMPQRLSPQWKNELGEQAEEIQQKYLHTFANLTLTAYNQEYGNRAYSEKRLGYSFTRKNKETNQTEVVEIDGFMKSHFRLSEYMKTHEKWAVRELEERGAMLLDDFLHLWPMITSVYTPVEKEFDVVSLDDDDVEFTGRKIAGYRYMGNRHDAESWKDMLINVCKILYAEKPYEMLYLATKNFNLHEKGSSYTSEVANGCHVWSSNNTKYKIITLRYIFEELNISPSELEIELYQADDNEEDLDDNV